MPIYIPSLYVIYAYIHIYLHYLHIYTRMYIYITYIFFLFIGAL